MPQQEDEEFSSQVQGGDDLFLTAAAEALEHQLQDGVQLIRPVA